MPAKRAPPSKKGRSTSLLPKIRSSTSSLPLKQGKSAKPLRTKKQKEAQKSRDASVLDTMNTVEQDWRLEMIENASREPTPLVQPKPKAPKELQKGGGELAEALSELEVAMAR